MSVKLKEVIKTDEAVPEYRWEQQRKEESRLIKGVFQDHEKKGGSVSFFFKKFKGDPIKQYDLVDGHEYELPLSVVKHLNSNCCYMQDSYLDGLSDPMGRPLKNPNPKKVHRFSFKPLEYN